MNTSTPICDTGRQPAGTVLVVDDDPMMREIEAELLSHEGYKVLQAEGPSEALWLARATAVDLLVTDFQMPEADGLELTQRFRAEHPGTPVLMVSGSLPELRGRTDDLERFALLTKPFVFAELLNKVRAMLGANLLLPFRPGPAT